MEAGLLRRAGGAGKKAGGELGPGLGVLGLSLALERKPETPAEMLGALLAGRLGGRLGQSECVGEEEEEEEEEEEGGAAAPWSMVGWDKRRQNRAASIYIYNIIYIWSNTCSPSSPPLSTALPARPATQWRKSR